MIAARGRRALRPGTPLARRSGRSGCWPFRFRSSCSSRAPFRRAATWCRSCRFSRSSPGSRSRGLRDVSPCAAVCSRACACAMPLRDSLRTDMFIRQTDTRTLARGYIEATVPGGAHDPDAAVFGAARANRRRLCAKRSNGRVSRCRRRRGSRSRASPYPVAGLPADLSRAAACDVDKLYLPYDQLDGSDPLAAPRREHVAFVVLKRYNDEAPATMPFITALAREGRRMAVFSPYRDAFRRASPSLSCTTLMPGSIRRSSDPVRSWRSGKSMVLVRKLRDRLATEARALPVARHAWARYRRRRYEGRIRRFLADGTGRADRLPMGAVYEATMRCNLHCEFCYVGDLLNIEGEWRQELPLDALAQAFPAQDGFQISLTGGEIFMRKDIMSVLDLFRDEGLRLRLPDDQRHDHHRGARGSARGAGGAGFPQAHQRLGRRPERSARRRARPQGHVRAHERGAPAPAGGGTAQRRAAPRQHQHDGRAREPRRARPDGRRRRGARRRRDRPQPPDVQHARGSRGDRAADRRARRVRHRDVRHGRSRARRRARARARSPRSNASAGSATSCSTIRPKVHAPLIANYYTPGAKLEGRCLYPFLHARVSFSGKVYFCPFIRVEVGDLTHELARGGLERRALRRDATPAARERHLSGLPPLLQGGALARRRDRCAAARGDRRRRAIPLTVVR